MREILFRGKRRDNGEWSYGSLQRFKGYSIFDTIWKNFISVDSKTIGQYTGLKDKNGVMIFEGDIVEIEPHGYIPQVDRGVVVFNNGCFGIEYLSDIARKYGWGTTFHRIGQITEWRDMGASGTITYTYEILGNIHDNPELLEEPTDVPR